jgi:hypothetical protein|nr:MAG TPA: hypothetical protein [Caudoviricetes sp.]
MDMTNIEKVIKAIKEKGFTIIQYPCDASIQKEDEEQVFFGKTPFGENVYELFINNEPDGRNFHNGCSVLGSHNRIPDIIWFKEVHDKITILGQFYI